MSISVHTNVSGFSALQALESVAQSSQTAVERLSSGRQIKDPGDNPSGFMDVSRYASTILGMGQAIGNTQNSVNMLKTADAALAQVSNLLNQLRVIAVSAANTATLSAAALRAQQEQVRNIVQSIDRIGQQTTYGNRRLLDGTSGVSANLTDAQDVSSLYFGSSFAGSPIGSGPVTATLISPATQASLNLGKTFASSTTPLGASGSLSLNGLSVTVRPSDTLQNVVDDINALTPSTGILAQISGTAPSLSVTLTQTAYGSHSGVQLLDGSQILNTAAIASAIGSDAVASITAPTASGTATALFTGGIGGTSGLNLTDAFGNTVQLTPGGNAGLSSATEVAQLSSGAMQFQNGPFASQVALFSMPTISSATLGTGAIPGLSLGTLDVTSANGATTAIQIVDDAIAQVSGQRSKIGSLQSDILQSGLQALQISQQNLTASQSQLQDADMAAELTRYTRDQILQQSATAALSHANMLPNDILSLLH